MLFVSKISSLTFLSRFKAMLMWAIITPSLLKFASGLKLENLKLTHCVGGKIKFPFGKIKLP